MAKKLVAAGKLDAANCLSALAASEAECGNFDEAIRLSEEAVKQSKSDREFHEYLLDLFRSGKPYRLDPVD